MLDWCLLAAAVTLAEPDSSKSDNPEAIIVTGERVKRSLKDTPSSVKVFEKSDIEELAAPDRLQQLLQLVPNVLTVSSRDAPIIRGQQSTGVLLGLPAFLGGARPRTIVQVDGRTLTFNEFVNSSEGLWDVSRVEVFRSPQTTTQGANSIAGAIFITSADPTYEPEARVRAIGGEYRRRQLSGMVSAPLLENQLAIRVAGDLYRSRAANKMIGPLEGGVDLNEDDYGVARVKLLAEPHALPGLKVLMTYSHEQSQASQGEGARAPFSERRDIPCICGYFKANVDALTAAITYSLTEKLESRTTLAAGDTVFRRFAVHGFGQTHIHGRDRSLESILQWKLGAPLSAVGGIAFQRMDLDQFIDLTATPLGTGTFKDRQDGSGLFGEVTWHPAPRVSLIGGARYQIDRQRRVGVLHTTPDLPLDYDRTVRVFLPKASVAYDFTDDVRVGLLIQRAYNPAGVTLEPEHAAVVLFDPEYLWDYEVFTRASLFGGALSLNGNLFYNDIRDAQRTVFLCLDAPLGCVGLERVVNDPRARTYGAELEAIYNATSRLTLRGAGGWLWSRVTKTLVPGDPIRGKEFFAAPRFTGTLAFDWRPTRNLQLTSQVKHNSRYFSDDSETHETRIQPSTTVDARVSWQTGCFTVFAYAQNLFDQFRITFWGGLPTDPDLEVGTNDPREIGVGLEVRF